MDLRVNTRTVSFQSYFNTLTSEAQVTLLGVIPGITESDLSIFCNPSLVNFVKHSFATTLLTAHLVVWQLTDVDLLIALAEGCPLLTHVHVENCCPVPPTWLLLADLGLMYP